MTACWTPAGVALGWDLPSPAPVRADPHGQLCPPNAPALAFNGAGGGAFFFLKNEIGGNWKQKERGKGTCQRWFGKQGPLVRWRKQASQHVIRASVFMWDSRIYNT